MSAKIDAALEKACSIFRYLPYILKRVDISTSTSGPSYMAWTQDNQIRININSEQANTPEKFELLLLHEVGHIIYAAHLFAEDPRWRESRQLVNIAQDLIINETIIDFDKNYEPVINELKGWTFNHVLEQYKLSLNLEMTWIEIYDKLKPFFKNESSRCLLDEHLDEKSSESEEAQAAASNAASLIIDALLENSEVCASIKGLNLSDIKLKKAKKAKNEKFKTMLAKYIGTLISFDKKASIMRPNRRSNMAIKGSKKDKKVSALVAVDTSGSISSYKEAMEQSFSVVLNYCDTVDVLPFSESVGELLKNVRKCPEFEAGGGENFQNLAPFVAKYDVVIVVSDLICEPPSFKEHNVIYLSKNCPAWVQNKRYVGV